MTPTAYHQGLHSGNPHDQRMRGAVLFPRGSPRGTQAGGRQGWAGDRMQALSPQPVPLPLQSPARQVQRRACTGSGTTTVGVPDGCPLEPPSFSPMQRHLNPQPPQHTGQAGVVA